MEGYEFRNCLVARERRPHLEGQQHPIYGWEKGLNMSLAFFRVGILKAVTVAVMNDDRLGNTLARCLCFRLYFSFMKQTRVTLCNKHLREVQIASSQKQLVLPWVLRSNLFWNARVDQGRLAKIDSSGNEVITRIGRLKNKLHSSALHKKDPVAMLSSW